ncbi:hypothetical protein [Acinetobacter sp.]|uniref:hypothetical protein n=1 Tax=Acinetobacter sp. TaxID=472 RepID=UPI00388DDBFD
MSTKLGTLTLDLLVKLGSFEQGMDQAERKTKKTTDNMGKAFDGFKTEVVGALGGSEIGSVIDAFNTRIDVLNGGVVAATGALAGMAVGGVAVAIGALSKLSIETAKADAQLLVLADRANTSIKSFQVLQYASQGLGVTQEQLGAILADTQEKLGEFSASAAGGAADFFDALKNNTKLTDDQIKEFVKTLQKKDGVDAIQALNNEMDKLGVTSQERRFILESLASELGNLAPLFAENGQAIRAFDEALTKAGLITTKESAEQSQLLAAQVQAVNLQYQGWKKELVTGFMPAMIDVANAFFGASKNGQQLQSVGQGVGSVLKTVAKVALGLSATFTVAGKLIGGVAAAIAALKGEKINTINMMFEDIEGTLANYGERIDSLSIVNDSATNSTNQLANAILGATQASRESTEGLKTNTKEADENAKAKEKAAAAAAKAAKEQENLNKMVGASALSGLRIKSSEAFAGGQVRGYTANFAQMAQKQLGSSLNRFTAFNDLYHKGTNSKHATGNAFDLTLTDPSKSAQAAKNLEAMARQYGYIVKVIDEYRNPSKRSTGGHLHVSVLGFKGTAEAAKMAQEELGLIASTNAEAQRLHDERVRAQQTVIGRYYSDLEKLQHENNEAIKAIDLAFANDDTARQKYLQLQEQAYQKDLAEYQEAQDKKRLEERKILLETKHHWMTAGEYARQYYALVRQEILNTPSYSPEMKQAMVKDANFNQGMEENSEREGIWGDYQSRFGSGTNEYQLDHDLLKEVLDQKLITEQEYFNKRAVLHAEWGQNYFAGTADVLRSVLGEESGFYQAAFAMQKAYAVAKVALNAPETYSNVYATVSALPVVGPYLAPVMAGAAVALQMAQAATLGSVTLSGMAHDGIDNVPKEGTWLLDKGERVVDSRTNADLKNYLQDARSQNGGGANIVINVPPGYTAQRSQQGDREVIDIVERYIGQQIQNPNSNLMKGITKKTTATVRR